MLLCRPAPVLHIESNQPCGQSRLPLSCDNGWVATLAAESSMESLSQRMPHKTQRMANAYIEPPAFRHGEQSANRLHSTTALLLRRCFFLAMTNWPKSLHRAKNNPAKFHQIFLVANRPAHGIKTKASAYYTNSFNQETEMHIKGEYICATTILASAILATLTSRLSGLRKKKPERNMAACTKPDEREPRVLIWFALAV